MNPVTFLIEKYKASKQHILNVETFQTLLLQAVEDGRLSDQESLNMKKQELNLADSDIIPFRLSAFATAFNAVKSNPSDISPQALVDLNNIQVYLQLADIDTAVMMTEAHRLLTLKGIQNGIIPSYPVENLVLQKGEKAFWSEPAIFSEERVIGRKYVGGSRGVSVRLMKGVSYRVGSMQGHSVSQTDIVQVSTGDFVITNQRAIFRGITQSFATKWDKVLDINLYRDGIRYSEASRSKARIITFPNAANTEIVGALASHAINHFTE
jgi:hypothetical protein